MYPRIGEGTGWESRLHVDLLARSSEAVTVIVEGELTEQTAVGFQHAIRELCAPDRDLVLNLDGVNFLTSIGLTALLELRSEHGLVNGHRVLITGASRRVSAILDATGTASLFSDGAAREGD